MTQMNIQPFIDVYATLPTGAQARLYAEAAQVQAALDRAIVATLDDYQAVRDLVVDVISEGLESSVPATIRDTVQGVGTLIEQNEDGVSVTKLAALLKLDKSTVSRRVRAAQDRGYLKNLEERRGKAARWIFGEPMPEDRTVLPSPAELLQCCSENGGVKGPPPSFSDREDVWEERAAIMEFEGGVTRAQAEGAAFAQGRTAIDERISNDDEC